MKTITSILIFLLLSYVAFSQSWGTTIPQVEGGYDVQYIPELNITFTSDAGNVITLRHDSAINSVAGPSVNKFSYFHHTLYAATNGSNSFRTFDTIWKAVPNVLLNARSFYLDTLGNNILILSESTEPYPGHVIQYDGSEATTIPGLELYTNADHSVTFQGKKYISYVSPYFESHLLMWDGTVATEAQLPDNFAITSLFVSNAHLYASFLLLGIYQLWEYDGTTWQYVLQFPGSFYCQGAFNDNDQAIYFFGSTLYKCMLPDTNLMEIDNPITSSIYAMTKDMKTGVYYLSSNYIFWWDGKLPVTTNTATQPQIAAATFRFNMVTKDLSVDYSGGWTVYNFLGQVVADGFGRETKNLGYLASGAYFIAPKEIRWTNNKFLVTR